MYGLLEHSAKYALLQQVIGLWITFIVLLVLAHHKFPNRKAHNIINLSCAVLSVVQIIALVTISLMMAF